MLRVINPNSAWVLAGDFNALRSTNDRRGMAIQTMTGEMEEFSEFIEELDLIDQPLTGRKYTWHRANKTCMSRLGRFLISEEWANQWEELSQWGMQRTVSDHSPIVLKPVSINWGLKPLRLLNCWLDNTDFERSVSEKWRGFDVSGSGTYILKEKLKSLKNEMKTWNIDSFGSIDNNIHMIVEDIK